MADAQTIYNTYNNKRSINLMLLDRIFSKYVARKINSYNFYSFTYDDLCNIYHPNMNIPNIEYDKKITKK